MPTIPLLKTNTELAMPKVPELDHVPRPQIDARGVVNAMGELGRAAQMPYIHAEPFVEAAGAKGLAMGRGLSEAGDVLGTLAERAQRAVGKERLHRQQQAIQAVTQQQAAAIKTSSNPEKAAADAGNALNKTALAHAAPVNVPPAEQAHIDASRMEGVAQGVFAFDLLKQERKISLADEALVSSRETAFGLGDIHSALNFEMGREDLGTGDMEHTWERAQKAQRVSLLNADPRQFRRLMGLPEEERPDFLRDIPQVEAQVQEANVDEAIAWKHAEVAGSISADIESGVLASSRELALKLEQKKYDPTRELSSENVRALMRKFQGEAINNPGEYLKTLASIATFDHAAGGNKREAEITSEILMNFAGDYEKELLSKLDQQVKATSGVAAMDALQQLRGTIHEDLLTNLEDGYFGSWTISANLLYEDPKTGQLMRHALPGERGDQAVKLSESDAAAYQKAKTAGGEAMGNLLVDDLTLKSRAERQAMGVAQSLEKSLGTWKFTDPQQLTEKYAQEMKTVRVNAKGVAAGRDDVERLTAALGTRLPPPGSVLAAESPDALAKMLDDGVDLPIYTKKFGGEYDPVAEREAERYKRLPVFPLKNNVNAPRRQDDFTGGTYTQQLLQQQVLQRRADKEREWNERITNDPKSLANNEMLEKALEDFADGNISNQERGSVVIS